LTLNSPYSVWEKGFSMYILLNRLIAMQVMVLLAMGIEEVFILVNNEGIYFRKNSQGNLCAYNRDNEIYFWDDEAEWYGV
jgi:hypothetical protein